MKRISIILCLLICVVSSFAQSAKEIVSRMESEMEKHESDGFAMTVEIKVPIVGAVESKCYQLGDNIRFEVKLSEIDIITWTDGSTTWIYNAIVNEVHINKGATSPDGNSKMFEDVTKGYDVSISSETSAAWTIVCKKSKSNKDKDAPKKLELVIAKGTYYPISMSTKHSGVTMTIKDVKFGATLEQVTFNPDNYPGVTIVDDR